MSNDTETMSLTAWLEQCIADDEAAARGLLAEVAALSTEPQAPWVERDGRLYLTRSLSLDLKPELSRYIATHDPARVLAQCAALRAVVKAAWHLESFDFEDAAAYRHVVGKQREILRALASIYKDRDGWQEAWA